MKKLFHVLLLFFCIASTVMYCQNINGQRISSVCLPAGCEQCTNVYIDTADISMITSGPIVNYEIDLDHNGQNDVKFTCFKTSAHGFVNYQVRAAMLNTTRVSASVNSGLIMNHDSLDLICENLNWSAGADTLRIHHVVFPPFSSQSSTKGLWNSTPKYMALRLSGIDTVYAWIKLSLPGGGEIHIYDYGIQKGKEFVGLVEHQYHGFAVTIFPNPSPGTTKIVVSSEINEYYTLRLIDLNGKTIFTDGFSGNNYNLSTSHLPSGIYCLQLSNSSGKVSKTIKLLVE